MNEKSRVILKAERLLRGVFTIPATTAFLTDLAAGITARVAENPQFLLTDWRILLPTRRAGRELRDAFLKQNNATPILLPRLQSIGDVDADELDMHLWGLGETAATIPHAIPPLERLFLLAELTRRKDSSLSVDQSLVLARGLARLIDQVHTEDLGFDKLHTLVPEGLATHWQVTLSFLEIVTDFWPKILAERGLIDPADRRNRLMKALIDFWQKHPPQTPVLAAGSTGSIPTTARLLTTISQLPQGMVILPALDTEMDTAVWDNVGATHPQATMKNLLRVMECTRADVAPWTDVRDDVPSKNRRHIVRAMMAPAADFSQDNSFAQNDDGLSGVTILETASPQEEATVIAVALRSILEDTKKTACFVTPDRILARRVMTALTRWGVDVDDSAGGALAVTPCATFLGTILRVVQDGFAPLPLLTFLKHPLCRFKDDDILEIFETRLVRGPRPAAGIEGLRRRLITFQDKPFYPRLAEILNTLEHHFSPLQKYATGDHSTKDYAESLLDVAQITTGGEAVFWSQSESESLATFFSNVIESSNHLPLLPLHLFSDVFHELLSQESFRETDPRHRRILFLGQLESRLVRRDVMILGGLNEGTWPADAGHDPWMSRPMRRDFGLPTTERGIGLAAHDFASHLSAPEVIVTRAQKTEGTASVPARWLQRLRALMPAEQEARWTQSTYLDWTRAIDKPPQAFIPISVPAPCPPREVRPQKLSVTAIEKWMNNPYRIYAERILKLRPLSAIDEDVTHAERGSFVHEILGDFVKEYTGELPQNARDILLTKGQQKFAELESIAPHWHYWWPRFVRIVDWFLNQESNWRKTAMPWIVEKEGIFCVYQSTTTDRSFHVTAKADRIDRLKEGGAFIIDYKTGAPPSWVKVANGLAPQLPLEGVIARAGGWREKVDVAGFAYWRISGAFGGAGEVKTPSAKTMDFIDVMNAAALGLQNLVLKFEDPQTPYMAMQLTTRAFDDDKAYAHLARTAEWASESFAADDDAAEEGENGA